MDKFKNRIKYYLIGLGIGIIFVYFMFGNRGCSWLPENRIKNMIGEKEIIVGDSVLAIMNCLDVNNDALYELLKDEGDVDFSNSSTQGEPKIYYISGETEDKHYSARFALYEKKDFSEVIEVNVEGAESCSIQQSNEHKSTLPLPHKDVIAILESNEFRILAKAECEMEYYGITEEALFAFHKTAKIDIENSAPRLSPNPFYIMKGNINGADYTIKYIIGENRTRIHSISGAQVSNCIEE